MAPWTPHLCPPQLSRAVTSLHRQPRSPPSSFVPVLRTHHILLSLTFPTSPCPQNSPCPLPHLLVAQVEAWHTSSAWLQAVFPVYSSRSSSKTLRMGWLPRSSRGARLGDLLLFL